MDYPYGNIRNGIDERKKQVHNGKIVESVRRGCIWVSEFLFIEEADDDEK